MPLRPVARPARLATATIALGVLVGACGALDEPESAWTADEEAAVERRAAGEQEAERRAFGSAVTAVAPLSPEAVDCVVEELVERRGEEAPGRAVDPEADRSPLRAALAGATTACALADDLAEHWLPELTVRLAAETEPLACVGSEATAWAAGRFADAVLGRLGPDESVVDAVWLGRVVDRCDAGAAMMAADATLHPRVGAGARTPSRWLCAAEAAPGGAFDALLDPAVTADEARLESVESRIERWFADCR